MCNTVTLLELCGPEIISNLIMIQKHVDVKVVEGRRLMSFLSLGLLSAVYLPRGLTHSQT